MDDQREKLNDAIMALRGAAPTQWINFVQAMGQEAAQQNMRMVSADPALLMRAQGMAMYAQEIVKFFVDAPANAEKYFLIRKKAQENAAAKPR